ncbi:MAG TPA: caspase family protein [Chitinophagaceae bacterium]|nr:caspase family protein [Chitinophagaceae bacterium]
MKKIILAILVLSTATLYSQAQTKRALIIAIGNYPDFEKNRWPAINSINDVPLIETALLKQDFPASNITKLLDEKATKTGIEKALDQLILSTGKGDIVVIHVSSHGQQIEDDNVNEEADGLDESIVPYGAMYSIDKSIYNKVSAGYLRDDVFGEKVTQLRNKIGKTGDLLVLIDACHSGSGIRGTALARGNNAPMVSDNFSKKKLPAKDAAGVFKENSRTKLNLGNSSNYVLISGAQAQEPNFECLDDSNKAVGSLSYAFSKTLSSLDGKITYRNLFARIEDIMREKAPKQKPVLEGDGIDFDLFGGAYKRQQPYITINKDISNSKTIVLNGGTVSGVTVGSVVSFFPGGTDDPNGKEPLQKGTVISSGNFTSTVKLDKEDETLAKKNTWAFVTETNYGNNKIKISLDSLDAAAAKTLTESLKGFELVDINSKCELFFDKSLTGTGWALRYPNTGVVFADDIDINNAAALKELLKKYDRFRYLQNLKFTEKGLSARVELVFVDAKGNIDLAKMKSRTKFGRMELKVGDEVYLKIVNTGEKKFYINIVDIQPDGKINPVIPNKKLMDINNNPAPIRWDQCTVNKGDSLFFKDLAITIGPPLGAEIFKVFLSADPLDLEEILTTNDDANSKSRGVLNNLAKIFKDSQVSSTGTRGGDGKINTAQNGTIYGLNFTIVEE